MFNEEEKKQIWKKLYQLETVINNQAEVIKKLREDKKMLPKIGATYRNKKTQARYIVLNIVVDVTDNKLTDAEMVIFYRFNTTNGVVYAMKIKEFMEEYEEV